MSIMTLAVLQARMSSSRLPGKVLADLVGAPMLLRQIERILRCRAVDRLVVATSTDPSDDTLVETVRRAGYEIARGSLDDVLDRFASVAKAADPMHVVRLTGDCPLLDPLIVDAIIAQHLATGADITTNAVSPTLPDGLDVEVMTAKALAEAADEALLAYEREHVTQFFYRRPERYRISHYRHSPDLSGMRWTVDNPEDLEFVREVYAALYPSRPDFGLADVLALLAREPELSSINHGFDRNEGLARSIAKEPAHGETR